MSNIAEATAETTKSIMTSVELLALINAERKAFGESEVRHNDFAARCKDELDGEYYEIFVVTNPNSTTSEVLELNLDQCSLVAMRESKGVRRKVLSKLKALALPAPAVSKPAASTDCSGLPEFRRARALDLATKTAERIVAQFPSLSEQSRQVVFAKVINPVAGTEILALPRMEFETYSAEKVGEKLGISANMVGRIANAHGLKTDEYGMFQLDKSKHSSKQVRTFVYNDAGVEVIKFYLDAEKLIQPPTQKQQTKVVPKEPSTQPQGVLL